MSGSWKKCVWAAAVPLLLASVPAAAQNQHEMTFHTVPPCTVVDTRVAGGAFAGGESRNYTVTGSGSLASQGGSSSGCAIPGFSNNIAQVQAVELAVTTTSTAGPGFIIINASDQSPLGAVINMTNGIDFTNTAAVAVAQTYSATARDIKVVAGVSGTHLILRVVGYYSKPVQTVWVHPVPGDATASGTALINALASIPSTSPGNPSSTKRYVVKLEPGIYDVGTAGLTMRQYVDIEGSGEQATVIQGPGSSNSGVAVVYGASSAELRDLQVKSTGGSSDTYAIPILLLSVDTRVSHVTATASGVSTANVYGIRAVVGAPDLSDVTISTSGGANAVGLLSKNGAAPKAHRIHITVNGASTGYGIQTTGFSASFAELDNAHVEVIGGGTGYGYNQDGSAPSAVRITDSTFTVASTTTNANGINFFGQELRLTRSTVRASGSAGTSIGIYGSSVMVDNSEVAGDTASISGSSTITIGGSKLEGGATLGTVTCAGVWDESYTFYAGPTCP